MNIKIVNAEEFAKLEKEFGCKVIYRDLGALEGVLMGDYDSVSPWYSTSEKLVAAAEKAADYVAELEHKVRKLNRSLHAISLITES